jgi:hypothetical protein
MTSRKTIHTVENGFCTVCGETEEWMREQGIPFEVVQAEVVEPITVPVHAKTQQLAVEQGGTAAQYGKIHKAGCRDLRDGMPIGEASTLAQAADLAEDALCWDYEPEDWSYAPCVRLPQS